jgi:hypothetical protein
MMQLKIDASKNQTITNLLLETFPAIQCCDNKALPFISPKTIAYIQALIIDSFRFFSRTASMHEHLISRALW